MEPSPTLTESAGPLSLGPRATERPADAGWTLVGGIDDPAPARVDGGGLVAPAGADWLVDWWIGADDRWYLPAREPAIRQRRVGAGPVIETAMRVPSGDVVATAYPVLAGGRRATAVEIRNASPVPVALAIAVRPLPLAGGPAAAHRLELVEPTVVAVDGRPAVLLPRAPNQAGAAAERDLVDDTTAGLELDWTSPVDGPSANAVCLYPLPHDTSLRFTVLAGDMEAASATAGLDPLRPAALPPPDTVARGWTAVVERAGIWRFPDPGIGALAQAARARLLLAAPGLAERMEHPDRATAEILEGLALGGHADECRPALGALAASFPRRPPADGAGARLVRAAATAAELFGPEIADDLLAAMTQLTSLVDRQGDRADTAVAQRALARLASRAGQPDAARHLRGLAGPADPTAEAATLDRLGELGRHAGPAGSWAPGDDARAAARYWALGSGLLLRPVEPDVGGADPDGAAIELLPTMPSAWMGGEVEVLRAPRSGARFSFAIRWHGYRPALLWEVEPGEGSADPMSLRLTCPGLDPDWSTDQPTGEALLSGSPDELPPPPAPGDSFA